jgi:hypothetical protein
MPNTGIELGADLYDLWRAGREHLPLVAVEYAIANRRIAETDATLSTAFLRPEEFGGNGGTYGPVYEKWRALRDEFQRMLADTAVNLDLTGDVLCLAAAEYARTDAESARELERLKLDNGNPTPPEIPMPQYPYSPSPERESGIPR